VRDVHEVDSPCADSYSVSRFTEALRQLSTLFVGQLLRGPSESEKQFSAALSPQVVEVRCPEPFFDHLRNLRTPLPLS
jgi:hypothetical protein